MTTKITYSVVVRDPSSRSKSTGIHREVNNCNHHHKTFAAASACLQRLTKWTDGHTCADWWNAHVEDSTGHEYDKDGNRMRTSDELLCKQLTDC